MKKLEDVLYRKFSAITANWQNLAGIFVITVFHTVLQ